MALCLVTGGAGFIGSRLVERLVARGEKVRVLDNFSTGLLSNLDRMRHEIEVVFGDLNNPDVLREAVAGVERLFHLAGPPWTAEDLADPAARWAYPSETLQVLMAAREAGVRRLIYASSCGVYGSTGALAVKEDDWVLPESPYGFAKLAGELQCIGFTSLYGLETVRLRYSEIFGPRQCPTSPYAQELPGIVKAMLAGQAPALGEKADQYRDFLYIDDAVHATLLAADASRVAGQVYNIVRGRSVTLVQVVETINQILGKEIQPIRKGGASGPFETRNISGARAETTLGFCPSIDLRQGLLALLEHYRAQPADPAGSPSSAPVTPPRGPHFRDIAALQEAAHAKPSTPPDP